MTKWEKIVLANLKNDGKQVEFDILRKDPRLLAIMGAALEKLDIWYLEQKSRAILDAMVSPISPETQ